jgi:hypothetical protein
MISLASSTAAKTGLTSSKVTRSDEFPTSIHVGVFRGKGFCGECQPTVKREDYQQISFVLQVCVGADLPFNHALR